MFDKILVAYDGTDCARPALLEARDIARLGKGELHLLGIVVTTGGVAAAGAASPDDGWGLEKDRLRQMLEVAAIRDCSEVEHVVVAARDGDPAKAIIDYAHEIGADLAVLGHGDQGLFAHWLHESTCASLLNHLPCSLLIATGIEQPGTVETGLAA